MFFPEIEPEAFGFSNINETEVDAYYPEVDVFLFYLISFFFCNFNFFISLHFFWLVPLIQLPIV